MLVEVLVCQRKDMSNGMMNRRTQVREAIMRRAPMPVSVNEKQLPTFEQKFLLREIR